MRRTRYHRIAILLTVVILLSVGLTIVASANPTLRNGATAFVANTDGDGLNLRSAPSTSASILSGMPEGALVEVVSTGHVDAAGRNWAEVRYAGQVGYGAAEYLSGGSTGSTASLVSDTGGFRQGALTVVHGTEGLGLNVRSAPGTSASIVTAVAEGAYAWVLGGPEWSAAGDPWYRVEIWGKTGWVHGGYLTSVLEAPTGNDAGKRIVQESMRYLGTPYLWAGTTPAGFDCSGYTYYVVNRVLSNNFPRAIDRQAEMGTYVSPANLRPGDLVFFVNTYQPGLSHVGIYISDGRFINAGNEDDIVGISNMWDSYWDVRFLTARRVTG
jgi:cell wall-associated NlpC family hydrolase